MVNTRNNNLITNTPTPTYPVQVVLAAIQETLANIQAKVRTHTTEIANLKRGEGTSQPRTDELTGQPRTHPKPNTLYGKLIKIEFSKFSGALVWYQQYMKNYPDNTPWEHFKVEVVKRFGVLYDDPIVELKNLKQTGSVQTYQEAFEALLNRVDLHELVVVSMFIGGLKPDVKTPIRMFQATTLSETYGLARMQEATNTILKPRYNAHLLPTPKQSTTTNASKAVTTPFKSNSIDISSGYVTRNRVHEPYRLTQRELEDKRAKGQCFYYDQKYAPGHKCSGQLHFIEVICGDNFDNYIDCDDETYQDCVGDMVGVTDSPQITLNALSSLNSYQTMRVRDRVGFPKEVCVVFFDDILIYNKNLEEHCDHLAQVLLTHKPRKAKKVTELPQTSVPLDHEADEMTDPGTKNPIGGADAHTRFETTSKRSSDPPLSIGHIVGSGKDMTEQKTNLTDFVPPTPHDSPLSGDHTLEVMRIKIESREARKEKKARTSQSIKRRLFKGRVETSTDKSLGEDASKQGRNDDHTEELNLTDGANTEVIVKDKGNGEKRDVTIVDTLVKMKSQKAKEKRVAFKDADDSTRPIRSITTLQPLLTIDPKDKGKGVLVEEELKKLQKVKRMDQGQKQEEATIAALTEEFDEIQAKIYVDHELAKKETIGSRKSRGNKEQTTYKNSSQEHDDYLPQTYGTRYGEGNGRHGALVNKRRCKKGPDEAEANEPPKGVSDPNSNSLSYAKPPPAPEQDIAQSPGSHEIS
uniref:Retrotransposon gag domain-containing protein n=1 Tax=Tanacetum cinerariifolium TaxID=118510 RepID=A0A6L2NBK6_TANCI|nr:hypothetical protein [Tanacetum cinerariifolium]